MPSPQCERAELPPTREGWATWLRPAIAEPGKWFRFSRSSRGSARQLAYTLRSGLTQRPPGRWEFTARGSAMYATYLGPEE
jgi:hypothetical protein